MSNFNKVLLMGRLTRDPELRYTPQGTAVSDIGVAVNREYTVGSEKRKETAFVDVTAWGRQAEVICEYLRKGAPVFIEGRLHFESWEQEGQKRSKLKVVLENFQFIGGGRGDSGTGGAAGEGAGHGQAFRRSGGGQPEGVPQYAGPRGGAAPPAEGSGETAGIDESDIPF
jgi:single-strand DNA-binding protein